MIMINDREFYDSILNESSMFGLKTGGDDLTISTLGRALRGYKPFFEIVGLRNLTLERARFLGFYELDNGIYLFPSWYGLALVDGSVYLGQHGEDWIYDGVADSLNLTGNGEHYLFGVSFDEDGFVIA